MTTNMQRLTFFCLRHQETCSATRTSLEVLCDQGPHVLSENYLQQKWDYCCACQSFCVRSDADCSNDKCLACDREITARYLCDKCDTLSFETLNPPFRREFSVSPDGVAVPFCPCCLNAAKSQTFEHYCPCLRVAIKTARSCCPFCEEMFTQPSNYRHDFLTSFNRPVSYYLSRINGNGIRAGYSELRQDALAAKAEGIFWLTTFEDTSSYMVFPSVKQVESAQRLFIFEKAFDCDRPAAGELWIVSPAIALYDQASGEFLLKQKGALEVRVAETLPQIVPPPVEQPVLNTNNISEQQQQATQSTAPLLQSVESVEKKGSNKLMIFIVGGVSIVIIAIIGMVISSLNSAKTQIVSKIKQGQLVTPSGNSAYDFYLQSSLSDAEKAEVRAIAVPILESNGNNFLARIARESYEPSSTDSDTMIRIYSWLDSLDPQNTYKARKRYFQGWQYYQSKDYRSAGNEFTQAMALDASWALPVNKMAHVALRNKDTYAARSYYEKAIERDPKWIFPFLNLGMLLTGKEYNIKDYYASETAARKALEIDPNRASAYFILGLALEGQHRDCEALSAYQSAIQNARNNPSPGFNVTNLSKAVDRMSSRLNCSGD